MDSIRKSNIRIMGIPEEEREGNSLFKEIMEENFPNLGKELNIQEAKRTPNYLKAKRTSPRHSKTVKS